MPSEVKESIMLKKFSLFLLAVLFVAGCSSLPKVVLGADTEEEEEFDL